MTDVFILRRGGESPLNFSLIGGAEQPEAAAENTIWVNTEEDITGWLFSPEEPEEASEGLVWIRTANSAVTRFNALKKNGLQVCPAAAGQYSGGAWTDREARIYQGGQWLDWQVYLYRPGDECKELTGGWQGVRSCITGAWYGYGVASVDPTVSSSDSGISVTVGGDSSVSTGGMLRTVNKLDLTNYSSLRFSGSASGLNGTASFFVSCGDGTLLSSPMGENKRIELTAAGEGCYLGVSLVTYTTSVTAVLTELVLEV